eukprot:452280-Amphidinium_carterae.1
MTVSSEPKMSTSLVKKRAENSGLTQKARLRSLILPVGGGWGPGCFVILRFEFPRIPNANAASAQHREP